MTRRMLSRGLLAVIAVLTGAALYWNGNHVIYMLAYIFSSVFLICQTAFAPSAITEKLRQAIVYALILAAQILFAVLVIRSAGSAGQFSALCRLLGALMVLGPFLVRQL